MYGQWTYKYKYKLLDVWSDGAIGEDSHQDVGNCDVMEFGSLLVGEIETRNPHLFGDLGAPCERVGVLAHIA